MPVLEVVVDVIVRLFLVLVYVSSRFQVLLMYMLTIHDKDAILRVLPFVPRDSSVVVVLMLQRVSVVHARLCSAPGISSSVAALVDAAPL
jgi:hypothetical protein